MYYNCWQEFGSNPVLIWSPVVERNYGQDPFLDQSPVRLFRDGNFQKIPVMAGITKDEFISLAVGKFVRLDSDKPILKHSEQKKKFLELLVVCLMSKRSEDDSLHKTISCNFSRTSNIIIFIWFQN